MLVVDEIVNTHARVAVYDDLLSSPRIIDIKPAPILDFMEEIASRTYDYARAQGGSLPYTVIREIAENFIHAEFRECTVSILHSGNTIRFSDQGPGIEKKNLVLQPGVTSANASMKQYIRGVGSGFPIVREYLERVNGYLSIDDNAIDGTVITLAILPLDKSLPNKGLPSRSLPDKPDKSLPALPQAASPTVVSQAASPTATSQVASPAAVRHAVQQTYDPARQVSTKQALAQQPPMQQPSAQQPSFPSSAHSANDALKSALKSREEQALFLLYEKGMLGSGDLIEPLRISAATATRLLQRLEELGFVELSMNKKRILSNKGFSYIETQAQKSDTYSDRYNGHDF